MPSSSCCALLAQALANLVAFPESASFTQTLQSYWSFQEASLRPSCIVSPRSAVDVSKTISILTSTSQTGQDSSCKFAIKSQGHAPAAGFANIADGVTIDLSSLKAVSLSNDKEVAYVGSGATWLDVYAYLDPFNLTVAGGRNGAVGVGGLTLGGGISYIGPRVGWVCDNVENFEVILATGDIVNANASSRPDLFRALKGGANNFGVVTTFTLKTFDQGNILAGRISSPFTERKTVFDAFAGLANSPHYDPYAEIVTSVSYVVGTGWGSFTTLAAYTTAEKKPATLQPFLDVPGTNDTLHLTPTSTWANESANPLLEFLFFTGTYGVSATLMLDMVERWDVIINSTGTIPGLKSWSFTFEPLPTVYTKYGKKNGGNSLGTTPQDGNAMILLLSPAWNNTSSDQLVANMARRLIDGANDVAKATGMLHQFQYLNYAGPGQHPLASYGVRNVASLKAVSRKYDPHGVFQQQVPGGFKL